MTILLVVVIVILLLGIAVQRHYMANLVDKIDELEEELDARGGGQIL